MLSVPSRTWTEAAPAPRSPSRGRRRRGGAGAGAASFASHTTWAGSCSAVLVVHALSTLGGHVDKKKQKTIKKTTMDCSPFSYNTARPAPPVTGVQPTGAGDARASTRHWPAPQQSLPPAHPLASSSKHCSTSLHAPAQPGPALPTHVCARRTPHRPGQSRQRPQVRPAAPAGSSCGCPNRPPPLAPRPPPPP